VATGRAVAVSGHRCRRRTVGAAALVMALDVPALRRDPRRQRGDRAKANRLRIAADRLCRRHPRRPETRRCRLRVEREQDGEPRRRSRPRRRSWPAPRSACRAGAATQGPSAWPRCGRDAPTAGAGAAAGRSRRSAPRTRDEGDRSAGRTYDGTARARHEAAVLPQRRAPPPHDDAGVLPDERRPGHADLQSRPRAQDALVRTQVDYDRDDRDPAAGTVVARALHSDARASGGPHCEPASHARPAQ
jgi:hypothetical protein